MRAPDTMAGLPSVTVVIATRDRTRLLADGLAAVARQSRPPDEVRIANAGDSDPGEALAALLAIDTVVIPAPPGSAAKARNRAARGARGEALAFLDDDDRWLPGHLEGLAAAIADPAVALVYSDAVIVREAVGKDGARVDLERRVIAHDWDPDLMRTDDYIAPSAWMVRRSLFEGLGGFDESFRYSEDWDFLMRAARATTPRRVAAVTAEIRMREAGNASADAGPERLECLRRLAERHGLSPLAPKTFWEVAEAVAKAGTGRAEGRR